MTLTKDHLIEGQIFKAGTEINISEAMNLSLKSDAEKISDYKNFISRFVDKSLNKPIRIEFYLESTGGGRFDLPNAVTMVNPSELNNILKALSKFSTTMKDSACLIEYGNFDGDMGVYTERPKKVYLSSLFLI